MKAAIALFLFFCSLFVFPAFAQTGKIKGKVYSIDGSKTDSISLSIPKLLITTKSGEDGSYEMDNIPYGAWQVEALREGAGSHVFLVVVKDSVTEKDLFLPASVSVLSEVVLTGVARATLVREDPAPIVAVSSLQIDQTSQANIIDVLSRNVPGLTTVKTGPNISKPFIRGLGYNRVLLLFDGIRQEGQQWGDEHAPEIDDYNIRAAEVIKGPSSIMYGSDAIAGVISLFSTGAQQRDGKIHGKYTGEYQTNNGLIGSGLFLGYADKRWSYVLRGSYKMAKNYTNPIDGVVYNTNFRQGNASGSIRYTSPKGFSDLNITWYQNRQGIPDGSRDSASRKFTKQIAEGDDDDITNRPIVSDEELNTYMLSPLNQDIRHYRIYSNHHYKVGKSDIDFSLGFQQNNRIEYNHPTATRQAGLYVQLNTVNYAFRYDAPEWHNIQASIGINGMYQSNTNKDATDFPIPDYTLFDVGSYLYAKWKKQAWTIHGGVRYDMRRIQADDFYTNIDPVTHFTKHDESVSIFGRTPLFSSFDHTFHGVSLSLGATFQISKSLYIKANLARGYRAPNITEFASNGLDPGAHIIYLGNRNLSPEFSLQEDVGIDFRHKDISISMSLFNNNMQNYIYLSRAEGKDGLPIVDAQGNSAYEYKQSSAQLYGGEMNVSIHPAFLPGVYFDNSAFITYGINRDKAFEGKGINGYYLPFIPPFKLTSSIEKQINISSKWLRQISVKVGVDYAAKQDRYLALDATETETPGYTLMNIELGFRIKYAANGNMIMLKAQASNVLNEAYQSNLNRLKYFESYSASPNGHMGIYDIGRNISIKIIIPF